MKRITRNLITALVVLGGGGGALVWTLKTKVKTAEERFVDAENQKRLYQFGRAHVTRARLEAPSSTVTLERRGERFWITSPVEWPADDTAVNALLDRVATMKIERVIAEEPTAEDLRRSGLDHPPMMVEVELAKGEKHVTYVGTKNAMVDMYPIAGGTKKPIGLSRPDFYWAFDRPLSDWREKRLIAAEAKDLAAVVVESGRGEVILRLTRGEGQWNVSGPKLEETGADPTVLGALLGRMLNHLKARSFLTDEYDEADPAAKKKYGFGPPDLVLRLEMMDGATKTVELGAYAETASALGTAVAHVVGSKTVVEVPPDLRADFARSPDELRDRTITRLSETTVGKLEIRSGGAPPIVLERSKDLTDWTIVAPERKPAKVWKADAIVRVFSTLRADELRPGIPTPAQLSEWYLEPPSRRVLLSAPDGTVLADVRIGKYADDEHLFVTTDGRRVDLIEAKKVQVLPERMEELVDLERKAP